MSLPGCTARSIEPASSFQPLEATPVLICGSPSDDLSGADPALPHRSDRQRPVAFGQAAPDRVGYQRVVAIARCRQV